jgi:hypothetical protein
MPLFKRKVVVKIRPHGDKVQILLSRGLSLTVPGMLLLGLAALWLAGPALAIAPVLAIKCLGFASALAGGLFTLQGGNFTSGGVPVANGSVILTLSNPAATIKATGGAATAQYTINLDALGNMPLTQVLGNGELTPDGTFYTGQLFSAANGGGSLLNTSVWVVGPSASYAGTLYPNVIVLPPVSASSNPEVAVAFSATPTFTASVGAAIVTFKITLTGNVTSSTLAGTVGGQLLIFEITQDGVGSRIFVWPANVLNPDAIDGSNNGAGKRFSQLFRWDSTSSKAVPLSPSTIN